MLWTISLLVINLIQGESAVIIGCYKLPSDWVKDLQTNPMTNELCQDHCRSEVNFSATQGHKCYCEMNVPTVKLTVNNCTSKCYGAGIPFNLNPLPLSKRCGRDEESSGFKTVTVTRLEVCELFAYGDNCDFECPCNQTNTATCDELDGTCYCKPGWQGANCTDDIDECTLGKDKCTDIPNSHCENTHGHFQCICNTGYQRPVLSQGCQVINCFSDDGGWNYMIELSHNITNEYCVLHCYSFFLGHGYAGIKKDHCYCRSTYPGDIVPKEQCNILCEGDINQSCGGRTMDGLELLTVTRLDWCQWDEYLNYCHFKCPCDHVNTASCDQSEGICYCKPGWQGYDCTDDIDECTLETDNCTDIPNSHCVNYNGHFQCICNTGYQISAHYQVCQVDHCYSNDNEWKHVITMPEALTNDHCSDHCYEANQPYTYAGTRRDDCYCRNTYPGNILHNEYCDIVCNGNISQSCGGTTQNGIEPVTVSMLVYDGWGSWSDWSQCNVTCRDANTITGRMSRHRLCNSPGVTNSQNYCYGSDVEETNCTLVGACSIDGAWGSWDNWSQCSVTCADPNTTTETMSRQRLCNNQSLTGNGQECVGSHIEEANCTSIGACSIDGAWGSWTDWSPCSITCTDTSGITSTKSRARLCNDPSSTGNGQECVGSQIEEANCTSIGACSINGAWGSWSNWSPCNIHCVETNTTQGKRSRQRRCNNPSPTDNGHDCVGSHAEDEQCTSTGACSNVRPVHLKCKCVKRLMKNTWHFLDGMAISDEEVNKIVVDDFDKNIKPLISINVKNVSQFIRKKRSMKNNDKISESIGLGFSLLLVATALVAIAIDLSNCFGHNIRNLCRRNVE